MAPDADYWLPTHLQVLNERESLVAPSGSDAHASTVVYATVSERASPPRLSARTHPHSDPLLVALRPFA